MKDCIQRTNRPRLGFTLIELLVVIAIIAILAAILFPVFAQAREKARQITCASNEDQLGLAIIQYVQDNDEHYPFSQYYSGGQPYDWENAVYPYVKNGASTATGANGQPIFNGIGGVWSCPDFPSAQVDNYGISDEIAPSDANTTTGDDNEQYNTVSDSQLPSPSNEVMLLEKGQGYNGSVPIFTTYEYYWVNYMINGGSEAGNDLILNQTPTEKDMVNNYDHDEPIGSTTDTAIDPGPPTFPRYRHTQLCNCLFADGHVQAMHKGSLSGLGWYQYIYIRGLCPSGPLY